VRMVSPVMMLRPGLPPGGARAATVKSLLTSRLRSFGPVLQTAVDSDPD
jgi:hypothetical protein